MAIEQINQLKQGSIISESSHYIANRVSGSNACHQVAYIQ